MSRDTAYIVLRGLPPGYRSEGIWFKRDTLSTVWGDGASVNKSGETIKLYPTGELEERGDGVAAEIYRPASQKTGKAT